jgi:hypothetical protein
VLPDSSNRLAEFGGSVVVAEGRAVTMKADTLVHILPIVEGRSVPHGVVQFGVLFDGHDSPRFGVLCRPALASHNLS